jgi:hypothetical protein
MVMTNSELDQFTPDQRAVLERHLVLGPQKAISYLPLGTIEKLIGISSSAYTDMITSRGYKSFFIDDERSNINSFSIRGAVYAYDEKELGKIIEEYRPVILMSRWPDHPLDFLERLATEWIADDNHPVMPVIRRAFGDK